MSKARLTYRFDEQGRRAAAPNGRLAEDKVIPLREEEYAVIEEKAPLNRFTRDYGAWESPFDAETRRIEQLIRESDRRQQGGAENGTGSRRAESGFREVSSPVRRRDEAPRDHFAPDDAGEDRETVYAAPGRKFQTDLFPDRTDWHGMGDWQELPHRHPEPVAAAPVAWEPADYGYGTQYRREDTPAITPVWDEPEGYGARYVRRPRTPWLKILASVAGAVVTGALLGFFVLSLFSGPPAADTETAGQTLQTDSPAALPDAASTQGTAATGAGNADTLSPVQAAGAIPARSYTLVQVGSFATSQAADAVRASLQKKGIAAVPEIADKVYLYIGLAPSKEAAQGIKRKLEGDKVDVFLKNADFPSVSKLNWPVKPDTLTGYLSKTDKFVAMVCGVALLHLEDENQRPLDETTAQSLKAAYDAWSPAAAAALESAPADAKAALQHMITALNAAKTSLDAYKKSPSADAMWQAQSGLLQTILAEKELFKLVVDK